MSMSPLRATAEPTRTAAHRWASGWRLVFVVIVVATLTHLPSLVRTEVLNPDEAFLATQAQVINDGGELYHDAVDRKPPLVPYLYAATFRVTGADRLVGVRALALGAHVVTALLLAAIARRRWGPEAAFAAAVLYLVASGGLVLEDSQPANFEVFMLPLMCASVLLVDRGRAAASGVAVGFATLAKQVGAATLLPLAYLAWTWAGRRGLALLGLGFGATILATAALFGWSEFFFWVFTDSGGYLDASDSWSLALQRGAGGFGVFLGANLGALLLIVFAAPRQRDNLDVWLWLASAVIAVAAGFRFFGHYFLQLAPPFALLAASGVPQAARWLRTTAAALAAAVHRRFHDDGVVVEPERAAPIRQHLLGHPGAHHAERSHLRVGSLPAAVLGVGSPSRDPLSHERVPDGLQRWTSDPTRRSRVRSRRRVGRLQGRPRAASAGADRRRVGRHLLLDRSLPRVREVRCRRLHPRRGRRRRSAVRPPMRVATWNIRHGRPQRGFASNRRLADGVRALDVDVLAVQEAERHVIRSWFADQPALIARAAAGGGARVRAGAPPRSHRNRRRDLVRTR